MTNHIKKLIAEDDNNGGVKLSRSGWGMWKWIIGALITLSVILPALSWMGGKNQAVVISGENVKKIPLIESEVKTLTDRTNILEYTVKEIPSMKDDIVATKEGVARLEGKIDVLIMRK